jgi:hypothetical protein
LIVESFSPERQKRRKRRTNEREEEFSYVFLKRTIPSSNGLPLTVGDTCHQIMKTAPTCFKILHLKFKFISL